MSSIKSGLVLLSISSMFFLVGGYLANIWLARFFGPTDYGVYGVIVTIVGIINIFQFSGVPQAASKYISEDVRNSESVLKSAFTLQLVFGLLLGVIVYISAPLFASVFNHSEFEDYLQLSALIFPFYGMYSLYSGYFNGLHKFKKQAYLNIAYSLVKLILIVVLGYFLSLSGAIVAFIIAPAIALALYFHYPKNVKRIFPIKALIGYSIFVVGYSVLFSIQSSVDLLFVQGLMGSSVNSGYYTASQNISKVPFYLLNSLAVLVFPSISRTVKLNLTGDSKMLIQKFIRFTVMMLAPLTVILSMYSEQIIEIIYSEKYLPAATSLSILLVGSAFFTIFSLLSNVLNGAGSPKLSMINAGVGMVVISILCYFLIPTYGLNGAAFSTSVGAFTVMTISAILVYKKFKVLVPKRSFINISIATILLSGLAYVSPHMNIFSISITTSVLFIFYFLFLVLVKEVSIDEIKQIANYFPKGKQNTI